MGVKERRDRVKSETRDKILDAARELFVGEGYEKVTMRRIAEAIEYSPTAIYLHFEDKDDLVLALCHEDFGRLLGVFEKAELPRDPVERIRQLGLAYAEAVKEVTIHEVHGVNVPAASPALLWRMKAPTHREQDTDDLIFLKELFRQKGQIPPNVQ